MTAKPAEQPAVIFVRAPRRLKVMLEEAARENGRSLNAEIVWRLRHTVEGYRK